MTEIRQGRYRRRPALGFVSAEVIDLVDSRENGTAFGGDATPVVVNGQLDWK
ncbi:hypothetical protein ABH922_003867 [Rhodococcus sp. 27YEA15]|uniref:hypothetical protein n=1 Tax=Rhodococcus sp. 27YEA15 TaxID=3156259 RepID=UPI003C7ED8FB